MDSDDDMELEAEEYESITLISLRDKKLIVQNPDGTLRCPVSPSRKKQSYAYKDLLQHATAVAVGKRGPEAAGKHSALKTYLEADLASLASPAVERTSRVTHAAPRRQQTEELLVCPWSIVIYNIDNSRRDSKQDLQIGLGKPEIKAFFAEFNPDKIHVFWGPKGHLGISVLQFGLDFSGLKDAQALEKSFIDKERGRRDYERNSASGNLGEGFYGWLARREDFDGRAGYQGKEMSKYLKNHGNLRDIEMVEADMKKIYYMQVQKLTETLSEKNEESLNLRTEIEIVRRKAEEERLQLEQSHKQELEAVKIKAQNSEEEYNQAIALSNRALQEKEAELRQREKELQAKESSSSADQSLLEAQKMENRHQREMISKQQDLQKKFMADKMKLIQKHEEENRKLVEQIHICKLRLAKKQKNEMEKQQLYGIIETEKIFDKLTINESNGKIDDLEKKLKELESSVEFQDDTINALTMKERVATSEIADARKVAAQILDEFSRNPTKRHIEAALAKKRELEANSKKAHDNALIVGVRWAGSIDDEPWKPAFQKRYVNDDWEVKMKISLSDWEARLRDSKFEPLKNVQVGNDKWEQIIDPENKELSSLRKEFGDGVYNSVTTALLEIEEYNASGRYPIPVAWVPEKSRSATLKEVIEYFKEVIHSLIPCNNQRKKARG